MMNETDYWKIYGHYIQLEIQLGEKYLAWIEKNPTAPPEEVMKKGEFLRTVEYLRDVFTKQYHLLGLQSRSQGEFIAEKKRLQTTAATNEYHLKRKIEEQQKEIEQLKKNIANLEF